MAEQESQDGRKQEKLEQCIIIPSEGTTSQESGTAADHTRNNFSEQ